MDSIAIIGDIHGDSERLADLMEEIANSRRLIFVGDYINRGSGARKVLDQIIALKKSSPDTVCLLGNHEAALLAFVKGKLPFYEFAGLGGLATIRAYVSRASEDVRHEFMQAFPDAHREFIEGCDYSFETPDLVVAHCGVDPKNPLSRVKNDLVMTPHEDLFSPDFLPSKLVVCGHYAQPSGAPYVRDQFICIDTGCGTFGGPLTALLLPERTFVQR
jgi:serine/threonine protein phosphatase 1